MAFIQITFDICVPRTQRSALAVRCRAGVPVSLALETGIPALRSSVKDAAARPGHESQRRIDRVRIFLLEPRDQLGGRQDLADAADALSAAPDFLPGLWLGALSGRVGAETHFRGVGFRKVV